MFKDTKIVLEQKFPFRTKQFELLTFNVQKNQPKILF